MLKRAKRLGKGKKKKKKKSSSSSGDRASSSSTSSSMSSGGDSGLFGEDTKLAKIWQRCPGALTPGGVREARQGLLNQAGTLWNVDQNEVPAIFTQYCRQQIIHPSLRASGDGAGTSDAMPGGGLPFARKTCWCGRYPMPTDQVLGSSSKRITLEHWQAVGAGTI